MNLGIRDHAYKLYTVQWMSTNVAPEDRMEARRRYFDERLSDVCSYITYTEVFGYPSGQTMMPFDVFEEEVYPNEDIIIPLLKYPNAIELYKKDLEIHGIGRKKYSKRKHENKPEDVDVLNLSEMVSFMTD